MKNGKHDMRLVHASLMERVRTETAHWDFDRWYNDGIDCYLAREVLYLCLEWNEPEKTGVSFDPYSGFEIALMAWEYAREMDDFTRLWNHDETKLEVLKECLSWIRNAFPGREGLREKLYGQPQEDH